MVDSVSEYQNIQDDGVVGFEQRIDWLLVLPPPRLITVVYYRPRSFALKSPAGLSSNCLDLLGSFHHPVTRFTEYMITDVLWLGSRVLGNDVEKDIRSNTPFTRPLTFNVAERQVGVALDHNWNTRNTCIINRYKS